MLGEERLLVCDSSLYVVDAFDIRKLGMNTGVRERPILTGRFLLKIRGTKIGERIVAAVVVELVAADKGAESKTVEELIKCVQVGATL